MSVRRLANTDVQPERFKFNPENSRWAKETIRKYPKGRQASAVIPLLMRAQDQDGWVTKAAIEHVSDMLSMPYIRVLEVATFYTQFQLQPVGTKAHIQVCGTTPCMLRGSGDLIAVCKRKINAQQFETNDDGTLSWEEVECQGACVNAPMVMVFKDTYEDLTPERFEEIIDAFEAGKGADVKVGTQIARINSAPLGKPTSLNEKIPAKRSRKTPAKPASKVTAKNTVKLTAKATAKPTAKKPAIKNQTAATPADSLRDKNRPSRIKKPRQPDDLKLISGVGPKLESVLNGLGVYTFAQIAVWKKAERDWVDGYLKFKGRIDRDQWLKQAKALANTGKPTKPNKNKG